ncbi:MAG: hypothetical protein U1E45_16145 [Geminicoccaceae bacterium]
MLLGSTYPAAHAASTQKLIFDWNKPVTQSHRGFPRVGPSSFNVPFNFSEGTLYFRAQIKSQPVPQQMKLQWCAWQGKSGPAQREACGRWAAVFGSKGNVVTWSQPVSQMWRKKTGAPIWTKSITKHGIAVSNSRLQAVSDYYKDKWHGEDPRKWYPLDLRFSVVIVKKGSPPPDWKKIVGG